MRPVIRRILGGTDPGPGGRAAAGLNPDIIKKLHDIFYNWYEGQHFLETLYTRIQQQEGDSIGTPYVLDTLLNSGPAAKLWHDVYQQLTPEWNTNTVLAARRIESLIRALRPLFDGEDNEITFPKYHSGLRYSFHDLSEKNWMQSLSRLLIRGYAERDPGESPSGAPTRANVDSFAVASDPKNGLGISFHEFDQFFKDFRAFGIDIKFFDPDDTRSSANRFREGDVFTYVSDGNGYLDLNETSTLLAFAISTLRKASRIHDDIASRCPLYQDANGKPILDKYGEVQIEDHCYRRMYFSQLQKYWNGLDEMTNYYSGLTVDQQSTFQYLLEVSGRKQGYQPGVPFNSDDTQGFVAALQYIEGIFSRYDVIDSGFLNPGDASVAFPVFKHTLQQMSRCEDPPVTLTDDQTELVFTYMLAKGKVPQGTWDVIRWFIEKELPIFGNFKADRLRILQIFEAIADNSHKSATNSSCSAY